MMRSHLRLVRGVALVLCLTGAATLALAQPGQRRDRDSLGFLKHALSEAGASALTTEQESQLNTLISSFHSAAPKGPDETLEAAHTAYVAALMSGDTAAAQTQAGTISSRTAELSSARLQASTKFQVEALATLKSGGQLDALRKKFGDDRVAGLVGSLAGGPPFGGPPFGGHPGGGPGFGGPPHRPERSKQEGN